MDDKLRDLPHRSQFREGRGCAKPSNLFHHGFYEVHLPVKDLDRSVDFYVEKLGFKLGFGTRGGTSTLLLYADGNARSMLGLFQVDTVVHRHPADYHISFRIAEEDVDQMIHYLRERGIEPVHPPNAPVQGPMHEPIVHGWMPAAAVFFRDPDEHLIELIAELSDAPRPNFVYRPLSEWRTFVETEQKAKENSTRERIV
jgi:lactoylglutathione lyase